MSAARMCSCSSPPAFPANDNLMELLICIDALRRASARRITAVIPYFGYARQDRKAGPRTPISAKLVANLITVAGADRVLSVDLHAGQIQGFFDIPTDNLYRRAGDVGGYPDALSGQQPDWSCRPMWAAWCAPARSPSGWTTPRSPSSTSAANGAGESEVMNIIGDVEGRFCVLIDDIVDSGGTLCNAAAALREAGADDVFAYVTHGVLSGGAVARVDGSALTELVITDLIASTDSVAQSKRIRTLDDRAAARRGDQADRR